MLHTMVVQGQFTARVAFRKSGYHAIQGLVGSKVVATRELTWKESHKPEEHLDGMIDSLAQVDERLWYGL